MMDTEWKYVETVQKRIRIIKVDSENSRVEVFDLDLGCPLSFNVDQQVGLGKIKRAKLYQATVKVYKSEFTEELEHQMIEAALNNPEELKHIKAMRASGSKPTRFDLIELKHRF
jgi:hypothetical protein